MGDDGIVGYSAETGSAPYLPREPERSSVTSAAEATSSSLPSDVEAPVRHPLAHPPHRILFIYGYLPIRLAPCSYPSCSVDERGVSGCSELACPECGTGPGVVVNDANVCVVCGHSLRIDKLGQTRRK